MHQKFWGMLPVAHAFAFLRFVKGGTVQELLHQLKYKGKQEVGEMLGLMYGNQLYQEGFAGKFDLVLPVPLHPDKQLKRGYNQCDSIAKGLAQGLQTAWQPNVLVRQRFNQTQTKKNREQRWQNVEDIFVVQQPQPIAGKNILLVDDVITTGATISACGQAVLQAGCQSLSIASLAIVQEF